MTALLLLLVVFLWLVVWRLFPNLRIIRPFVLYAGGTEAIIYDVAWTAEHRLIVVGPGTTPFHDIRIRRITGLSVPMQQVPDSHGHTLLLRSLEPLPVECTHVRISLQGRSHKMRPSVYQDVSGKVLMSTLIKNEARNACYWVEHMLDNLGVDHVILYDNGSSDLDKLTQSLKPWRDRVQIVHWPFPYRTRAGFSAQTTQQNHSLQVFGGACYIGLFDIDEYLLTPSFPCRDIGSYLDTLVNRAGRVCDDTGGVSVECRMFANPRNEPVVDGAFRKITTCRPRTEGPHACQKVWAIPRNIDMFSIHMVVKGKPVVQVSPTDLLFHHYLFLSDPKRIKDLHTFSATSDLLIRHYYGDTDRRPPAPTWIITAQHLAGGRFGNQCFIVAACFGLHAFLSRLFPRQRMVLQFPLRGLDARWSGHLEEFRESKTSTTTTIVFREPHHPFETITDKLKAMLQDHVGKEAVVVDLHGYFQSRHFFEPARLQVLSTFRRWFNIGFATAQYDLGIHVRRTDYLTAHYLQVCTLGYYKRALHAAEKPVAARRILIVTDDPNWCRTHLVRELKIENRAVVQSTPDDFITLATQCKRLILSNSTYSLWAAFLSLQATDIYFPNPWHNPHASLGRELNERPLAVCESNSLFHPIASL